MCDDNFEFINFKWYNNRVLTKNLYLFYFFFLNGLNKETNKSVRMASTKLYKDISWGGASVLFLSKLMKS